MRIGITRHNLGTTLLFFVVLWMASCYRWCVAPIEAAPGAPMLMPLGALLNRCAAALPPFLSNLTALLMLLTGGILLTRLISRNMILLERTYMPVLIYLIVGCGTWYNPSQPDALAASLLMIASFDRTINSFRREVVYTHIFNATLLHGIAILTYAPTAIYAAMLPIALLLFRKRGREWIVALAGLILPTALCSYIYWGFGAPFTEVPTMLWKALSGAWSNPGFLTHWLNPILFMFWGVVLILTLWSLYTFVQRAASMRTRPHKAYLYFIWILLFTVLLLAAPGRSVKELPLLAIPLAIIIPTCFNRRENAILNTLYLLLLTSIILYNILPLRLQ